MPSKEATGAQGKAPESSRDTVCRFQAAPETCRKLRVHNLAFLCDDDVGRLGRTNVMPLVASRRSLK